jgi:RNA polymerase sigma-70 factor (ECF subfamily)
LRGTARNLFRASRRTARRGVDLDDDAALEAAWQRLAGDDGGESRLAALRACVAGLPARERDALALRFGQDVGREAIARRLGMSTEGVKAMLRRVKARLRVCVERRLDDAR